MCLYELVTFLIVLKSTLVLITLCIILIKYNSMKIMGKKKTFKSHNRLLQISIAIVGDSSKIL